MLKCRELVSEADLLLDGNLGWRDRLAARFHLLICHHCRRYVRQLHLLISAIPNMHKQATETEVDDVMHHINRKNHSDR
ncbi:MAG: zf-HC2 domain-containing protein [Gammaproteobacteria bacterium]|nr:MAG: zf-HC2 domain-containing protein [Gammaproteobacteria bacterium]